MGKLLKDEYGYYFVSDTGIRYEILEGMSVGAEKRFTSEILFIMLQNCNYNLDNYVVDWVCGSADLIEENEADYVESINEMVETFERKNKFTREVVYCATGGGIDCVYIPLTGGNVLVIDSDSFEIDGSFTVYRGVDEEGLLIEYSELTYPENVILYGSKEEIDDGSSEYLEAYKQAIAFFDGQYRYTC